MSEQGLYNIVSYFKLIYWEIKIQRKAYFRNRRNSLDKLILLGLK